MLTEIHLGLTAAQIHAEAGGFGEAAEQLAVAEDVLHRAIACGAMVDPWNVLGFQGLYPLFVATEDSVPDHRIHDRRLYEPCPALRRPRRVLIRVRWRVGIP